MGMPFQNAARSLLSAKQLAGVLRAVPRRSQPTMSNRPAVSASRASPRPATMSTPESPGPPGLTNSDPIRCAGRLARWRITDRVMDREPGWAQSKGTGTVAHSSCGPQDVQLTAGDAEAPAAAAVTGATVAAASPRAASAIARRRGAGVGSASVVTGEGSSCCSSGRSGSSCRSGSSGSGWITRVFIAGLRSRGQIKVARTMDERQPARRCPRVRVSGGSAASDLRT